MPMATTNYGYDVGYAPSGVMAESASLGMATGLSALDAGSAVRTFVSKVVSPQVASVNSVSAPEMSNTTDRMVVKVGSLSMVVTDVNETIKNIADYAYKQNGYVVSSNVYKRGLSPYGTLIIKIPAKSFDEGLNEVKSLGEVVSDSVNGQDVTEEYVDLDAQLRNLQATEKQFLTILAKAEKITDILAVQRELTQVRGQIEQLQGRMKYLRQSADMSTITVDLSTDPSVLPSVDNSKVWKPWAEVKTAARALVEVGKKLVNQLIWLVIFVPIWLVIGLVVWVVVRVVKKIRGKGKFKLE